MIENLVENLSFISLTWQILTPMIFMLADIITGLSQAIINKNVDTSKMRVGLIHKMLLILIILLSLVIDIAFNISFISRIVCVYLTIMEIISISENMTKAGIDLGKLSNILKIKWEGDEKKNGEIN